MSDMESSLEYLSGAFKGLSTEKKDSVLHTARALLKVQDANNYPGILLNLAFANDSEQREIVNSDSDQKSEIEA
jgi:hypothetical protein